MIASSGAQLLQDDAVETLVGRLFPLATVVTPNLPEAEALTGLAGASRRELAERLVELGAAAAIVTGGHGEHAVDHLFDGARAPRDPGRAARGGGDARRRLHAFCDARGAARARPAAARTLPAAPRRPRRRPSANGLVEIGAGEGPVDVLDVKGVA